MRSIVFLLSILMVSYVLSDICGGTGEKADDCKKLDAGTGNYCCLTTVAKVKTCLPYNKENYDKIPDIVDAGKKADDSYSIDCGCSYLSISLLGLLLFLI